MSDLISRNYVLQMLKDFEDNSWFPTFSMLRQTIFAIPSVDTEPIRNDGYNQGGINGIKKFADRLKDKLENADFFEHTDGYGWTAEYIKPYEVGDMIDELLKEMGCE